MDENRKLPRHRRRFTVSFGDQQAPITDDVLSASFFAESSGDQQPAITADVSSGGFCVEMSEVLVPGSQVQGTLYFGSQEVPFTGEVTWATPVDPRASTRGRFGVRFTEVGQEFQEYFKRPEAHVLVRWHT